MNENVKQDKRCSFLFKEPQYEFFMSLNQREDEVVRIAGGVNDINWIVNGEDLAGLGFVPLEAFKEIY